jgi:hypothetical protein
MLDFLQCGFAASGELQEIRHFSFDSSPLLSSYQAFVFVLYRQDTFFRVLYLYETYKSHYSRYTPA